MPLADIIESLSNEKSFADAQGSMHTSDKKKTLSKENNGKLFLLRKGSSQTSTTLHKRSALATSILQPMMMNVPFIVGMFGQSVLTIPMVKTTSQGVKMDEGIWEDEDPVMVVLHKVLEKETDEEAIMLAMEMANII
jgi:hypothetical protein